MAKNSRTDEASAESVLPIVNDPEHNAPNKLDDPPEQPSEEKVDRPPMRQMAGLQYNGIADVKRFTSADLRKLGVQTVKSETDLVWSRSNGFFVSVSDVNAETVDAILKLPGFSVV